MDKNYEKKESIEWNGYTFVQEEKENHKIFTITNDKLEEIKCDYLYNQKTNESKIHSMEMHTKELNRYIEFNENQFDKMIDMEEGQVNFTIGNLLFPEGYGFRDLEPFLNEMIKNQQEKKIKNAVRLLEDTQIGHIGAFQMQAGISNIEKDKIEVNLKDLFVGFEYMKNSHIEIKHHSIDLKDMSSIRRMFEQALKRNNGISMTKVINNIEACFKHSKINADMNSFYKIKDELCAEDIKNNPLKCHNHDYCPEYIWTENRLKVPIQILEQQYPESIMVLLENERIDNYLEYTNRTKESMLEYLETELSIGHSISYKDYEKGKITTLSEQMEEVIQITKEQENIPQQDKDINVSL